VRFTRTSSLWASPIFQAGHEASIPFARANENPQVRGLAVSERQSDGLVPVPLRVLIDQCCTRARMAGPRHQLPEAGAGGGGESPADVAQVLDPLRSSSDSSMSSIASKLSCTSLELVSSAASAPAG